MNELTGRNAHASGESDTGIRYYDRDFWHGENLKYAEPHYRLLKSARVIRKLAGGRSLSLLDIGCGPAALVRLLPPNIAYHGVDIAIHDDVPYLTEADIVKSPIDIGREKFDIILAQGFFEYVGDYQSQKFAEIAELLADDGTFVVSYVNFGHRKPTIYDRYSNIQPIERFRADLARYFDIRKSFPTSHNWEHSEPNRNLIRAGNMRINFNVPFVTPKLAVQYFFLCTSRT
jgi:SAM-dependent methyltransferase